MSLTKPCLWTCPVPSEDVCSHLHFILFLLLFFRLYKSLGRCLLHCNSCPEPVSTPFTRFLLVLPDPESEKLLKPSVVARPWQKGSPPATAHHGKGRGWWGQLRPAFFICSHSIVFYSANDCLLFHSPQCSFFSTSVKAILPLWNRRAVPWLGSVAGLMENTFSSEIGAGHVG